MPERLVVGKAGAGKAGPGKAGAGKAGAGKAGVGKAGGQQGYLFCVFLKKTRNPPPKKTILNQFKQKNNLNQKKTGAEYKTSPTKKIYQKTQRCF